MRISERSASPESDRIGNAMQPGGPPTEPRIASTYSGVQQVLADERFVVAGAGATGPPGTISWLRASVSRFANGAEHRQRLAFVLRELHRLDARELRSAASERSGQALTEAVRPGERVEVMCLLARRIPVQAIAAGFGLKEVETIAEAVIQTSAGYFPGSSTEGEAAADEGVARLIAMFGTVSLEAAVARISVMVQACEATAGVIGAALHVLQEAPECGAEWETEAVLAEVLRHRPMLQVIRRVASESVPDWEVGEGEPVVCDIDAANRDPAVFDRPDVFDPGRERRPTLTFGYGLRPCPASDLALALAAGVVEAVRQHCTFLPGEPVRYVPPPALRVPERLEVLLSGRSQPSVELHRANATTRRRRDESARKG